jgi:hypothetical protein
VRPNPKSVTSYSNPQRSQVIAMADDNPHFRSASSWSEAAELVAFTPRQPSAPGHAAPTLRIHVRDHRHRELPVGQRTLEAHYGDFVVSQAHRGEREASRLALRTRYGSEARTVHVGGHEGRAYTLGPEVPEDDVDGRMPAVVTWADGPVHFLVASGALDVAELLRMAESLYAMG